MMTKKRTENDYKTRFKQRFVSQCNNDYSTALRQDLILSSPIIRKPSCPTHFPATPKVGFQVFHVNMPVCLFTIDPLNLPKHGTSLFSHPV